MVSTYCGNTPFTVKLRTTLPSQREGAGQAKGVRPAPALPNPTVASSQLCVHVQKATKRLGAWEKTWGAGGCAVAGGLRAESFSHRTGWKIEIPGKNRKTNHCAGGNPSLAYASGREKFTVEIFVSPDSKLMQVNHSSVCSVQHGPSRGAADTPRRG